jgi:hypothetical protein
LHDRDYGNGGGEAVQEGLFTFDAGALEESALRLWKNGCQKTSPYNPLG